MTYVSDLSRAPRGSVEEKPLLLSLLVTLTLSAVFVSFPQIDIALSRLFYVEGQGFPAARITAPVLTAPAMTMVPSNIARSLGMKVRVIS